MKTIEPNGFSVGDPGDECTCVACRPSRFVARLRELLAQAMEGAMWRVLYYENGLFLCFAECETQEEAERAKMRAMGEGKKAVYIKYCQSIRADLDG